MIQLRIRSEYTFGETFASVERIIERLKAIGCTAAGIVDKHSTWGHVKFFKACKAAGIEPMLGVELIVSKNEDIPSMWFLAKNETGLSELYDFTSRAHRQRTQTRRGKLPRLYFDDVLAMSDNIFKFAGDVVDETLVQMARPIMDLNPSSRVLDARKIALAKRFDLPIVNTSDNSFCFQEDSAIYEMMTSASLKPSPQYILENLDAGEYANRIAEESSGLEMPKAQMVRAKGDLEALCRSGMMERNMGLKWTSQYEERLLYELELIRSKDFESYFTIVADMVHYAKQNMLVGPSRGSAAGSLVCYLTRITEIDPIPPKLYFERFIDVSRTDLPDIDLDFPDSKRHLVFEYMAQKYGDQNTAHIGTISEYRPKSALTQVCKALRIPALATAAVKAAMIERASADARANNCLEDTLRTTAPGIELLKMYPQVSMAAQLEGHASHTGVHAAGLLICNEPITKYATVDDEGIAHIEKGASEYLGLLKIDVLGLRTLGILEDSGLGIDWYNLSFDDPKTYDVFNQQRLCGIFQFEGNALRTISKQIKFNTMVEIDAVTALARPGPFGSGVTEEYIKRKNGKPYTSIHPLVERHMSETFGLPVYQEQTLAIVREIGKFDWKETSTIRKAMSKRMGKEFFDKYWEKFKQGAMSQDINEQQARQTWEMINNMGAWQMNRAHTWSYAVISYWTAYLKANHPLEFAAANLRNAKDDDSAIELLREMVAEGISYIPFDLELSEENWCAKNGRLIGGFSSLHGIGASGAKKYKQARDNKTLNKKDKDKILSCNSIFSDIFPFKTKYGNMFENPAKHGIATDKIYTIKEITGSEAISHGTELVFFGEVIYKNSRDANEEVIVKKRGGKLETGQTLFVDMRLRDDTGMIGGRIGRFDWFGFKDGSPGGKAFVETVKEGAHLLVRAKFFNNIKYAFVTKYKVMA